MKMWGVTSGRSCCGPFVAARLLKLGAGVVRKFGVYQRLCGSLQIAKIRQLLDWNPSVPVDESLQRAAKGFHL
jgi:nucleoside-diphosphate-sugar epimerase